MIDLITLVKPGLSNDEVSTVVSWNCLQTNSKDGVVFYDNLNTKNLAQHKGVFIRIETNQKLKVEGSLHKYFNDTSGGIRGNHNLFTMADAEKAFKHLVSEKAIPVDNLRVYNYEIGINLNLSKNCRTFLDKMKSIGPAGGEKQLYVNPRYKDERVKTTVFHTHTRKYFKAYDKVFELKDKKKKHIPDGNILRIETAYRRLDNCLAVDFFHPDNLHKLVEAFFRDWRTIQFYQDIITPKGTGRARQHLCIEIMDKGPDAVLKQAKERHKSGVLKDWEYRNIREFVTREWNALKKQITFIQSVEECEFRELLRTNHTLLSNAGFIP
ncbi:hypothetical protein LJB87_00910 [Alistipes sp. OttesenSCG-928-L06]|nr:hypothetical protein [Alistipes sp. OttesenSCG-928-L06]